MRNLFFIMVFITSTAHAGDIIHKSTRVIFSAEVVSSACHVRVSSDSAGNNLLTFVTYNRATRTSVPPQSFSIRFYESGSFSQGCTAFLVGQVATLSFGNPGQLDSGGVVTHGAGDQVRIDVRAIDSQADYRGFINLSAHTVNYPVDFAAKGELRFTARPVFPDKVLTGEYSGALTFVVEYR
ncbi:fimbrial protein [Obesumbacterium proteus]|nr:fimbrial protein [Obesumbacterium proteus]TBL77971.1 fimbrial protein [Obesumbacterium proteus]